MTETAFSDKCQILTGIWLEGRDVEQFEDFITYNDLGLPLAYMLTAEIVGNTVKAEAIINETFDMLLELLNVPEDVGFKTFDEMVSSE